MVALCRVALVAVAVLGLSVAGVRACKDKSVHCEIAVKQASHCDELQSSKMDIIGDAADYSGSEKLSVLCPKICFKCPTVGPTAAPTEHPTVAPTSTNPTTAPTPQPTTAPTKDGHTNKPTTASPTTIAPTTLAPTSSPTLSNDTRIVGVSDDCAKMIAEKGKSPKFLTECIETCKKAVDTKKPKCAATTCHAEDVADPACTKCIDEFENCPTPGKTSKAHYQEKAPCSKCRATYTWKSASLNRDVLFTISGLNVPSNGICTKVDVQAYLKEVNAPGSCDAAVFNPVFVWFVLAFSGLLILLGVGMFKGGCGVNKCGKYVLYLYLLLEVLITAMALATAIWLATKSVPWIMPGFMAGLFVLMGLFVLCVYKGLHGSKTFICCGYLFGLALAVLSVVGSVVILMFDEARINTYLVESGVAKTWTPVEYSAFHDTMQTTKTMLNATLFLVFGISISHILISKKIGKHLANDRKGHKKSEKLLGKKAKKAQKGNKYKHNDDIKL